MPATRTAKSPSKARPATAKGKQTNGKTVEWTIAPASRFEKLLNIFLVCCLMFSTPPLTLVLGYITTLTPSTAGAFVEECASKGLFGIVDAVLAATRPTPEACAILLVFNALALLIYFLPGPTAYGPLTACGHKPEYKDNGLAHCFCATLLFVGGSEFGVGLYKMSILFDHFPQLLGALNVFGLAFCLLLYVKGLYFPSGPDHGVSGNGFLFDYYWGTELYPRLLGVDVKKFVNCRFSMTFWQLAGLSFTMASYERHGALDPGLLLCAVSQYLYLVKFYLWEIGYMRSIDIIVDRAGFYETWGCIVWVPSVYTLHTRSAVLTPSGLSWPSALAIFTIGLLGVGLNFWADDQRQRFREKKGKCTVWGKKPVYIDAQYDAYNATTGKVERHRSLLLASGWWGTARHFQYFFELTAAWSWGLLAGVQSHGPLPLFYPAFLTILLFHRAHRDEQKCLAKYGVYYEKYMKLVPYSIIPYVY